VAGPPVLILGGGLTALGVLRLLGRRGVPAFVWPPATDFVLHSRWYRTAPAVPALRDAGLNQLLQELSVERAVLMPVSDAWSLAVARRPEGLRGRFPASVPGATTQAALVDKHAFAALLAELRVGHPTTIPLARAADVALAPDDVVARGFLKPHDSQSFFGRYGVKAWRVRSRDEAAARLAQAVGDGHPVLLQEYVPGPASQHYFVDGFADRESRIRGLFARRRLRMYPPDFGNSSCMVSIAPAEVAEGVEAMERLVAHLRYRGIFSAEFKRDERDGRLKLLEVNARPWWYVEFAGRCGVDVVAMAYEDALGRPTPASPGYAVGRELVFPSYDWPAVRQAGHVGPAGLLAWMWRTARADQPVWSPDDPGPCLAALGERLSRRLARAGRRPS
jgi:predicted ATP-grasp superfamily ATP-dependent carboligase